MSLVMRKPAFVGSDWARLHGLLSHRDKLEAKIYKQEVVYDLRTKTTSSECMNMHAGLHLCWSNLQRAGSSY